MNHFFCGLDLETATNDPAHPEYALQPYRAPVGQARITSMAVSKASGASKVELERPDVTRTLSSLAGQRVVAWNGLFDVAWLMASGYDVTKIIWFDGLLLWKWVANSQATEGAWSWSLAHAVKHFKKVLPNADAFIEMKKNAPAPGTNPEYWERRAKLDAYYTVLIAELLWSKLTPKQQKSAGIEAMTTVPTAEGWIEGIHLDISRVDAVVPVVTQEMEDIEWRLGVHINSSNPVGNQDWRPSPTLRSPKKLGNLLYEVWKYPIKFHSEKTGAPATHKAALTYLSDDHPNVLEILRWRALNTQLTKFLQAILKSTAYLQMGSRTFPAPKQFGTKTGRYTYGSKTRQSDMEE